MLYFVDEAPKEILARGPDAVIAYQEACTSGTKIIYRSRLMLVGQDRAGKTSLKKALIGLEYVFLHTNNYITSGFH
jgi:GTPase SAR1 family protein